MASDDPAPSATIATSPSKKVVTFKEKDHQFAFLFAFAAMTATDSDYASKVAAAERCVKLLKKNGYEIWKGGVQEHATAKDFIEAIRDPSVLAVVWNGHGNANGTLFVGDDGGSEYFSASGGNIVVYHSAKNPDVPPIETPPFKIGAELRLVIFYACRVASPDAQTASKLEDPNVPPSQKAFVDSGLAEWKKVLGPAVHVYGSSTERGGSAAMNPDVSCPPHVGDFMVDGKLKKIYDASDLDIERSELLGPYLKRSKLGPVAPECAPPKK